MRACACFDLEVFGAGYSLVSGEWWHGHVFLAIRKCKSRIADRLGCHLVLVGC